MKWNVKKHGNQKMKPGFVKGWDHADSPLLWVELIYIGDTKKMPRYFGFCYGNHYFISRNQATTFYKNRETEKKAVEYGASKYSDPGFIRFFAEKSKEIEHDLLSIESSAIMDRFDKFVDKYSDLVAFYRFCRPDFYQKVTEDLQDNFGEKKLHLLLKNQFENLDVGPDTKTLVVGLKQVGERRFEMHKTWVEAYKRALPLFEEIGRKIGLTSLEVQNCTTKEIAESVLEGREINIGEVKDRIKHFKFVYHDDSFEVTIPTGQVQEDFAGDMLKGHCASGGRAKGRVVVLQQSLSGTLKEELDKVKRGAILVTHMTSPDMVPAMEKAAAILTNEGGMLCHAAIISREMGIPCIVGTGRATEVLKDGDYVEVDAEEGIIRKVPSFPASDSGDNL